MSKYCKICQYSNINMLIPVNDFHLLFWHGIQKGDLK